MHSVLAAQEDYDSLTSKTLSFLRTATNAWDAEYIVKVIPTIPVLWKALPQGPETARLWHTPDNGRCIWLQVDDDVYLHLQHLRLATQQWQAMQAGAALSVPFIL